MCLCSSAKGPGPMARGSKKGFGSSGCRRSAVQLFAGSKQRPLVAEETLALDKAKKRASHRPASALKVAEASRRTAKGDSSSGALHTADFEQATIRSSAELSTAAPWTSSEVRCLCSACQCLKAQKRSVDLASVLLTASVSISLPWPGL